LFWRLAPRLQYSVSEQSNELMMILKRHLGLATLGLLLLVTGCAKRECGKPLEEVPKDISALEWRLVSSTEPETKSSLTRFNFLVFKFESNFTGLMKKAMNNVLQEDNQAKPFLYAGEPNSGDFICIEYLGSQAEKEARLSSGNLEELCGEENDNLFYYSYRLDRWGLKLQDLDTGDTYHFCPFEGAFSPLSQDSSP